MVLSALPVNMVEIWDNLHLLQSIAVVCTGGAVVDHLFDFRVWAGIFHGSVFVAAADTVVCLCKSLVSNRDTIRLSETLHLLALGQGS